VTRSAPGPDEPQLWYAASVFTLGLPRKLAQFAQQIV
jgi:hypothetical protein